jgi:23S rRNA (cytosine1962-C5)-methyltransferase
MSNRRDEPRLVLSDDGPVRAIERGHPWAYQDALRRSQPHLKRPLVPGQIVRLDRPDGFFLARAYSDPASALAARVLLLDPGEAIDEGFVRRRLEAALDRRARLFVDGETTAYRVCNGEGDGLPGVVIDRYGDHAVLRADGDAALAFARDHAAGLWGALSSRGYLGVGLRPRDGELALEWQGAALPESTEVREHGMTMWVDLARGQKTGAFLDQRENRRRVRDMAAGLRVLNLFSYAGGFSLAAALGGARQVTSVDIAAGGHAAAQRSFVANQIDPAAHRFVTSDVFVFLARARAKGERWDLVISDPPSFSPSEKAKNRAIGAYRKLHEACLGVLAEGSTFCAASCSSHLNAEDFLSTLDVAPGRLTVLDVHGNPPDHPTTPAWAEGRYLKFIKLSFEG